MNQFPPVVPSARSFGGAKAMTSFKSVAGGETRVLLSDKAAGHQLDLMFENVLELA